MATEAAQGDFFKITAIFCFENNSYEQLNDFSDDKTDGTKRDGPADRQMVV